MATLQCFSPFPPVHAGTRLGPEGESKWMGGGGGLILGKKNNSRGKTPDQTR